MLVLNPAAARFGAVTWEDVTAVGVDRLAVRAVEEWTDFGPYCGFADVPEQRVRITVVRRLVRDDAAAPRPGESAELRVRASPTGSEAWRRQIRATCVVMAVRTEIKQDGAARQVIELAAVSGTGAADPVVVEQAETWL